VQPIYDETIEAPTRVKVDIDGGVTETSNLHEPVTSDGNSQTIGAVRNTTWNAVPMFDAPENDANGD
jgi:hypothetical protein